MSSAAFVYVSCADAGEIWTYNLQLDTGALTHLRTVFVGAQVMPLATSPDRRYLYAALRNEQPELLSLKIGSAAGELMEIGRVPIPDSLPHISVDARGRYLLGASYQQGTLRVHPIGTTGVVEARPVHVEGDLPTAHSIKTDASNRFALSPVLSADATLQWLFNDETGTLTPNPVTRHPSRPGAGPRHFVFHPNNRFVFIVHELDATVEACSYDMATGRLEHLQTIDQLPVDDPAKRKSADIQITADGRFLYASERTTSTLTGYAVDGQTGKLEPIGRYVTATHPRGFQIDPRGKFLLCAGQKSASVIVHRIDQQTGSLTELSRHPAGVGACWVEIVEPLP